MTPHPIHEIPIEFLADCCRALLAPYNFPRLTPRFRFNYAIKSANGTVIPDFRLDLEPGYQVAQLPMPVWIMECGFSQARTAMECQLEKAAAMFSGIDVAVMISIRESGLRLPGIEHTLFSRPALEYTAFTPALPPPPGSLPPIVIQNIVWVNVKAVNVYVFLRGEDGRFDFSEGNPLSARGVSLFN
jgi:hypothetical protein